MSIERHHGKWSRNRSGLLARGRTRTRHLSGGRDRALPHPSRCARTARRLRPEARPHARLLAAFLVYQQRLARLHGSLADAAQKAAVDLHLGHLRSQVGLVGGGDLLGHKALHELGAAVGLHLLGILPHAAHLVVDGVEHKAQVGAARLLGAGQLVAPGVVAAHERLRVAHAVGGVAVRLRLVKHRAVEHRVRPAYLGAEKPVHKAHLAALAAMQRHALEHPARHLHRLGWMVFIKFGARKTERRGPADGVEGALAHLALKVLAVKRKGLGLPQHGNGGIHVSGVGLRATRGPAHLLEQGHGKAVVHRVVAQPAAQIEIEQARLLGGGGAPQVPEGTHGLKGGQARLTPDAHEQLVHVHEGEARRGRGDDALAHARAPREVGVELLIAHRLVGGEIRLEAHAGVGLGLEVGQELGLLVEHLARRRITQVVALGEVVNQAIRPRRASRGRGCLGARWGGRGSRCRTN